MAQEERLIPPLVRANFTQEEEEVIIGQIGQRGGLPALQNFFPAIVVAVKDWATNGFYEQFVESLPPPVKDPLMNIFVPDYHSIMVPKRDAPLRDTEPQLKAAVPDTEPAAAAPEPKEPKSAPAAKPPAEANQAECCAIL